MAGDDHRLFWDRQSKQHHDENHCAPRKSKAREPITRQRRQRQHAQRDEHLRGNDLRLQDLRLRVGARLEIDAGNEAILHNQEASRMLTRNYREGFIVPDKAQRILDNRSIASLMLLPEDFKLDDMQVRPYFELGRVLDGILDTTARMFGIEYRRLPDAPVWHPDVTAWEVTEHGRTLGRFFLDLFPREGKYKHAAQFTLASGVRDGPLPEGALVCNFSRPGDEQALLDHGEVVTFFHEFGHLLHHLFGGRTRWAGLSGVRTEWDFVEAPSQMLEEWCWDASVLQRFARPLRFRPAFRLEPCHY